MNSSNSTIDPNICNWLLPMVVLNIPIAIIIISLNLVIIVAFYKTPSLRTPSYLLILGLALADFFTGAIAEPVFCSLLISYCAGDIDIYNTLYPVQETVSATFTPISFYTLTAITIDRFLAIYYHLRYQLLVTTERCIIVLVIIWIFGISLSLANAFINYIVFVLIDLVMFIGLIMLNGIFMAVIYRVINRHSTQIRAQEQITTPTINIPRYKKTVNTIHLVMGAFVLCYVPHSCIVTMDIISINTDLRMLFTITETLVMLNSVLNPVIYCWRVPDIRNAVYQVIRNG